jgi:hypothetical protein
MHKCIVGLGTQAFLLCCESATVCQAVSEFLNPLRKPVFEREPTRVMVESTNPGDAIALLVAHGLALHQGEIWIDASLLRSPEGKSVLIAGPSCSGKTTLTSALTLQEGYKIICEDIAFIKPETNTAEPNGMPLSIRPGTVELLTGELGLERLPLFANEWFFQPRLYQEESPALPFDLVCFLSLATTVDHKALTVSTMSCQEMLRALMPISNALRIRHGVGALQQAVAGSSCINIINGGVAERVQQVCRLARVAVQ